MQAGEEHQLGRERYKDIKVFIMNRIIIVLFILLLSCDSVKIPSESPLAVVIKLNSAELNASLETANKFIDVNKVYARYSNDSTTANQVWASRVELKRKLNAMESKTTGEILYYDFEITENIGKTESTVTFIESEVTPAKRIVYKLENRNGAWVVVGIDSNR